MKVLVVDDRPDNVYLLTQLLKSRHFDVIEARNGVEGLEKVRSQPFDLIVSDIMMPEMDGFQFCHTIKRDENLKRIPFVFYTATYTDSKDEALALSLGANAFIVKPAEPQEFLQQVEAIVAKTARGKILPRQEPPEEAAFLRQYNERLIHKLEDKLSELEKTNQKLTELTETLEKRVEAGREELVAKNRELEGFTYSVSHDLRAPLRTISALGSMLHEELESQLTDEQKDLFKRLLRNTSHLQRLIEDLLQYSHVSNTRILLAPVSLEQVMDRALEQMAPRIEETRGVIEVMKPMPSVIAYEPVLTQIFINLLDNALKFVGKGVQPRVRVTAEANTVCAVIKLTDNGIGIPPELRERVFGAFERGTSDKHYSGSGVGLAIVQKGIQRMGGKVSVTAADTNGSCFIVELPLAH